MADGAVDTGVPERTDVGGVEGAEAMYVKLIASDGHEFIMKRSHALTSGTIKAMLSGPGKLVISPIAYCGVTASLLIKAHHHLMLFCHLGQFAENETNEVKFREIP